MGQLAADASGLLANFIPPKVMPARAVAARALAASVVEAMEAGDGLGEGCGTGVG
jgi:hypothetical protein